MSDPHFVWRLSAQWREKAEQCAPRKGIPNFERDADRYHLLRQCADELDAALTHARSPIPRFVIADRYGGLVRAELHPSGNWMRAEDVDADLRALQGQIAAVVQEMRREDWSEHTLSPLSVEAVVNRWADTLAAWLPPQTTEG